MCSGGGEKHKEDSLSSSKKEEFIIFILNISFFFIISYGLVFYLVLKMWLIFAVPLAVVVSFVISTVITIALMNISTTNKKVIAIIMSLAIACGASYSLHSYSKKLKIEIAEQKREEERKEHEEQREKEQARLAQEAERLAKESAEYQEFLQTGASFKLYEENTKVSAQRRAENVLRQFAKDPGSVQDVTAVTNCIRAHIRGYPLCRYIIQVRYRAKNSFGAFISSNGIILLDGRLQGIGVLEALP